MFDEPFTERAREVVRLAEAEARGFGHRHVGSEHLLLGMLADGQGLAARALVRSGVTAEAARAALVASAGARAGPSEGQIPFTPEAKKVLELALRESLRLEQGSVDGEHLLLGLTDLREGEAVKILTALGAGPEQVRHALSELMDILPGQAAVHRDRSVTLRRRLDEWVQIRPSEGLRRLVTVAAGRASDGGRTEIEPADLLLAFTLRPGPATPAGLPLEFDESSAAVERDRAWSPAGAAADPWARVGPSDATSRLLMTAAGHALIRGSSLIALDDLLLALIDDGPLWALLERIGLDRFRLSHSIKREHSLRSPEAA